MTNKLGFLPMIHSSGFCGDRRRLVRIASPECISYNNLCLVKSISLHVGGKAFLSLYQRIIGLLNGHELLVGEFLKLLAQVLYLVRVALGGEFLVSYRNLLL